MGDPPNANANLVGWHFGMISIASPHCFIMKLECDGWGGLSFAYAVKVARNNNL